MSIDAVYEPFDYYENGNFLPNVIRERMAALRQNEFIFFRVYSFYAKKIWCPIVVLFLIGVVLDFLFV